DWRRAVRNGEPAPTTATPRSAPPPTTRSARSSRASASSAPTSRAVTTLPGVAGTGSTRWAADSPSTVISVLPAGSPSMSIATSTVRRIDDERSDERGLEKAMFEALPTFEGAFSLVVMDQGRVIGARDPHGFRPLCLGELPEGGWVLASETAALDLVGA